MLFDTLLKKLSKDEILAVLGHELGHFKHKDIFKNIAIVGVMLFILFLIFHFLFYFLILFLRYSGKSFNHTC